MFNFPITEEQIRALDGKTIVFCDNLHGDVNYHVRSEVRVLSNGKFRGGYFDCASGTLNVYDRDGLWAYFDALEYNGASVFLRGCYVRESSENGNRYAAMHIKHAYGSQSFGICISSCSEYAAKTVPPLLKTLASAKIDADRIAVVIGGYTEDSEEVVNGIRTITKVIDGRGLNGLWAVTDDYEYWLLLHDTTNVERDIAEKICNLDIGLLPDVIRAEKTSDIGFYKSSFIKKIRADFYDTPAVAIEKWANVVTIAAGETKVEKPRDIYGRGEQRNTRRLPIGVLKFESTTLRRSRGK